MKRILVSALAILMLLSFCACGAKNVTLENISDMYVHGDDDVRATFTFESGTMTVKITEYIPNAASPTGKIAGSSEEYTKSYTLDGENQVVVDGTSYYYEIDEEELEVKFSVDFMGLTDTFDIGYIKD